MKTFVVLVSISAILAAPTEKVINKRHNDAAASSEAHASVIGGHSGAYYQQSGANSGGQTLTFGDHGFSASASNSGAQAEQFNKNIYVGTTVNSGAATISLHQASPAIHHGYSGSNLPTIHHDYSEPAPTIHHAYTGSNSNSAAIAVTLNNTPSKRDIVITTDSHTPLEATQNTKSKRNVVKSSADSQASLLGFGHANSNANTYVNNPGYAHNTKAAAMSVAIKSGTHNIDVYAKGSGDAQSSLFFNSNPSAYYGSGSIAQAGASASSYGGLGQSGASAQAQAQSGNYGYYPHNANAFSNSKASANAHVKQY